ncbi:hypothetical protein D1007_01813 [Hordeum vulgare]|nr:hypothetical protein D1007_01813 [Hordeum vulgare]
MAAMRVDAEVLEENLGVDSSRVDVAKRLAAINDSSWFFVKGIAGAFDEDYNVFSQRARAYLSSKARMLVTGKDKATHHYERCTHGVEASPSSRLKEPIVMDISDDEE